MGLLDGGLAEIVGSAFDFLMLDAVLIDASGAAGSVPDGQGGFTPAAAPTYPCRGFVQDDQAKLVVAAGGSSTVSNLPTDTRTVTILAASLPAGVQPDIGDKVQVAGKTYGVLAVGTDPATAAWQLTCR